MPCPQDAPKKRLRRLSATSVISLLKKGIGRREAFAVAGVSHMTMYTWLNKGEQDDKDGIESDEAKLLRAVQKAEGDMITDAMEKVTIGKDVSAFEFMRYMQTRLDRKEAKEDAARERESGGMDGYKPPPTE